MYSGLKTGSHLWIERLFSIQAGDSGVLSKLCSFRGLEAEPVLGSVDRAEYCFGEITFFFPVMLMNPFLILFSLYISHQHNQNKTILLVNELRT